MLSSKFVVYTALFGNYDKLKELSFKSDDCDYICFTDQDVQSNSWTIIKLQCDESNTILMNRKLKMLPHLYLSKYDASLYIDSNIKLTGDVIVLFNKYLSNNMISLPTHFERVCIYDEVDECIVNNKISKEDGDNWKMFLKQEGFPLRSGLGENNIIIRKHNESSIVALMNMWWKLFQTGPKRDQLSLMYLLWKKNVPFLFMKESSRNNNPYFQYYLHNNQLSFIRKVLGYIEARKQKNIFYKVCFSSKKLIKRVVDLYGK